MENIEPKKEFEMFQAPKGANPRNTNDSSSPDKIEIHIKNTEEARKDTKKLHYSFFIFVNPGSGDSKAALLTKLDVERFVFSSFNPNGADVEVYIYNLRDPKSRAKGLGLVKTTQEEGLSIVRVIVGGGDGSIMWAVQEMAAASVSFDKCAIGTIPFGTGNDFSRVLGWGPTEPKSLLGTHLNSLKGMVDKWVNAQIEDFDVWEITIETYENGGLKQIQRNIPGKKFAKKFMSIVDLETGKETVIHSFKKMMCNYFSFGVDSRIGYGFDKGRTKSRCGNKVVYFWEGLKKLFTKTPRVNDIVDSVHNVKVNENGEEVHLKEVQLDGVEFTADDFLMYPGVHLEKAKSDGKVHLNTSVIKGNPSVFLCLNIPSYMGGASDPWRSSKGKPGVHMHDQKAIPEFGEQRFGDGKIEILTFGGPLAMAAERMLPGRGKRVGQAKGPFTVNFKKSVNDASPLHTYMQIDGEFYDVVAPKRVKVSLCPKVPKGKIKVMMNSQKK